MRKKFPDSEIDFLLSNEYADVMRCNPKISALYELDKKKSGAQLPRELIGRDYDLVIDLQNNLRSRSITGKLNAKRVVRFIKPTIKKFLLVRFKINLLRNNKSIPELYAEAVPDLKLDSDGLEFYLEKEELPDRIKNKIVGLCPGSKHFTKMWPPQYHIELGRMLIKHGYQVHVLGGSADKSACELISAGVEGSVNKCTENNLFETAGSMLNCKAIVCNDSGLMHLGSALKIPLIAIFGSTVKEFGFFPYKSDNLVLENNSLSCRPCSHIGKNKCPLEHFDCMNSIKPGFVFEQLKKFL